MARLLFVTSRLPFPPREGHQLRSWHLLRAAAGVHDVTLLSLRRPEDPQGLPSQARRLLGNVETIDLPASLNVLEMPRMASQWLSSHRPLLDIRYANERLRRAFRRHVRDCDLVHLDMLALAGLLRDVPATTPSVLNEHNVESDLLHSRLEAETTPWRTVLLRAQMARLVRFERDSCLKARCVLACSTVDAARLRSLAPGSNITVIPNGVDTTNIKPDLKREPDPESLLFVGQMGWFPNRDGVAYFNREILPLLGHRRHLYLDVVGRRDGYIPDQLAPNIRFQGFVDDLHDHLQRASVFIVPLRHGSGTRLKVLEAMATGKAIVSTSKGVEGIALVDGVNAMIADTPEGFARAIERLLDAPDLRDRLGKAARLVAIDQYDWRGIGEKMLSVYEQLLAQESAFGTTGRALRRGMQREEQRHGAG